MPQQDIYDNIREEYISGKIFNVGDVVLDRVTSESLTVTSRGTNYIIVESTDKSQHRKWLDEVVTTDNKIGLPLIKDGQILFNNNITENLDQFSAEYLIEVYSTTNDLFAWRQAVINIDNALSESNLDNRYDMLLKAEEYLSKMDCELPLVEEEKQYTEQRKIAQLLVALMSSAAAALKLQNSKSPTEMITVAIKDLKAQQLTRQQWSVIAPLIKVAVDAGIPIGAGAIPYSDIKTESVEETVMEFLSENLDDVVEDLHVDDLLEAQFDEEDLSDDIESEQLMEVLSYAGRLALARSLRARQDILTAKRVRALHTTASTGKLLSRARKLAVAMLKRRIARTADAQNLSVQEKQRIEQLLARRKAVIARLAVKLLPKVKQLQKQRLGY